ncbi:S-adenosylmethionine:tRNA ribosyltransferase-isomerase, queuosine biosynthesis protein QueA [Fictibacillus macauensis ZFHKF-1]|uniref:S-adenosylmethionine:tRNA ribosyltransferase-isomerase, queuosine biosynthesis protein QueA n=1 Tax=Fictibacillus macauensis ZFHKF-1 TaxID=1196324 RepID=I8UKQ1_9BACL|nr:S-adenosylmethionine:tRNA ribosyltransferase-isomerase [Fictibacillus macauensis]EIT87408.1 S-adenosylmethionine:tRNA ribosyltransferase-isomerase, queuosine biosynthesis protein QueA [Fictibacillus macauensis ZFHKF-1]
MSFSFALPSQLNAALPPEKRGVRRDYVKMLVINTKTKRTTHDVFFHLSHYLERGDVVVLNASRTLPAVLTATSKDRRYEVRLARRLKAQQWEVLVPHVSLEQGEILHFSKHLTAVVEHVNAHSPFITLFFHLPEPAFFDEVYKIGEPVRYEYIETPWKLDYYQTVFGSVPGSVEMPSAGRAFSWELLFQLQAMGVKIAFVELHTGLSYLMDDRWHIGPRENKEFYNISKETANVIHTAKQKGKRIIAVGTTVVRALESAAASGTLQPKKGWTNLYISEQSKLQIVDGLITGLHEPEASHLDLLTAFVPREFLQAAYSEAVEHRYLWHEFGDMNLII